MGIMNNILIKFMLNMRNGMADSFKSNESLTIDLILYAFDKMISKSCEIVKEKNVLYQIPAGSICKCNELSCSNNFCGQCTAVGGLNTGNLEIYSDGSCSLYKFYSINGYENPDIDEIEKITNERIASLNKEHRPEKFEESQEIKDAKLK